MKIPLVIHLALLIGLTGPGVARVHASTRAAKTDMIRACVDAMTLAWSDSTWRFSGRADLRVFAAFLDVALFRAGETKRLTERYAALALTAADFRTMRMVLAVDEAGGEISYARRDLVDRLVRRLKEPLGIDVTMERARPDYPWGIDFNLTHRAWPIAPRPATPGQRRAAAKWNVPLFEGGRITKGTHHVTADRLTYDAYPVRYVYFEATDGRTYLSLQPLIDPRHEHKISDLVRFHRDVARDPDLDALILKPAGIHFVRGTPRILYPLMRDVHPSFRKPPSRYDDADDRTIAQLRRVLVPTVFDRLPTNISWLDQGDAFEHDYLWIDPATGWLKMAMPVRAGRVVDGYDRVTMFRRRATEIDPAAAGGADEPCLVHALGVSRARARQIYSGPEPFRAGCRAYRAYSHAADLPQLGREAFDLLIVTDSAELHDERGIDELKTELASTMDAVAAGGRALVVKTEVGAPFESLRRAAAELGLKTADADLTARGASGLFVLKP